MSRIEVFHILIGGVLSQVYIAFKTHCTGDFPGGLVVKTALPELP